VGYGSVAAGGRYDNLVGMFSGKKKIRGFHLDTPRECGLRRGEILTDTKLA
jgi:histidyl-tRNA synthetase